MVRKRESITRVSREDTFKEQIIKPFLDVLKANKSILGYEDIHNNSKPAGEKGVDIIFWIQNPLLSCGVRCEDKIYFGIQLKTGKIDISVMKTIHFQAYQAQKSLHKLREHTSEDIRLSGLYLINGYDAKGRIGYNGDSVPDHLELIAQDLGKFLKIILYTEMESIIQESRESKTVSSEEAMTLPNFDTGQL